MVDTRDQPRKSSLAVYGIAGVLAVLGLVVLKGCVRPRIYLTSQARQSDEAEDAAFADLTAIAAAEKQYHDGVKAPDGKARYVTLDALGKASLVDAVLAKGHKDAYIFEVAPSTTTPEQSWWGLARPASPGWCGRRIFYVNQEGTLYERPIPEAGHHDNLYPDPKTCALPEGLSPARD